MPWDIPCQWQSVSICTSLSGALHRGADQSVDLLYPAFTECETGMRRKPHGQGVRGHMPGRAVKSWRSAPSHIAGGAGCLLEHVSTSTGQVDSSSPSGWVSEVFPVLEAVKVEALAASYP